MAYKPKPNQTDSNLALEATVMLIREELMAYFKGSYVQRLTSGRNIELMGLDISDGPQRSRRWQQAFKDPRMLRLGGAPLMTLGKAPDRALLHSSVFNRSPQLRQLKPEVKKFFKRYLPGVDVQEQKGPVFYG
jgi:hypothetical protein